MKYVYLTGNAVIQASESFFMGMRDQLYRCARCSNDPEWVAYHDSGSNPHQTHEYIASGLIDSLDGEQI